MASDRCLEILLSAGEFDGLPQAEQAERLSQFMSVWFEPGRLNVVDHVRWTQRIGAHAAKLRISVGESMELLLPNARRAHSQAVYENEARRIHAEDQMEAPSPGGAREQPGCEPVANVPVEVTSTIVDRAGHKSRSKRVK